jgi:hypothetical protein
VSVDVCVGADLFFREPFGGNGRTCATCHPANHNLTIDPGFIATLPSSDPLFLAETNPVLAGLEKPALMRQFGLILENLDGADSPTTKFVMRSVPHVLGLAVTVTAPLAPTPDGTTLPPLQRTGWSGDGAPGNGQLRDFQTGAVFQHYTKSLNRISGVDFVLPAPAELDAIVAFMGEIGRTNDIDLSTVSLTDPGAEAGRLIFMDPLKRCNGCHHNAGANNASGVNRNFNTGVERAKIPAVIAAGAPFDGGFGSAPAFNFDANGDGTLDSFGNGTFNTPSLIEAADTGPFFHTNAFTTIEAAISFYTTSAFAISPSGNGSPIPLSSMEIANVGRFLRGLNASLNCQMALFRVSNLIDIIESEKNHNRELQQTLADLARAEVLDALADLNVSPTMNPAVQTLLQTAKAGLDEAVTDASHVHRLDGAQQAQTALGSAISGLGSGMNFTMGAGTLMF